MVDEAVCKPTPKPLSVSPCARSVLTGRRRGNEVGEFLPQNTQNGRRPSLNTRKVLDMWGERGPDFCVSRVPRSVFCVFSGKTEGENLPLNTLNGRRPSLNTRKVLDMWGTGARIFVSPVCREASSVCSVAKRRGRIYH